MSEKIGETIKNIHGSFQRLLNGSEKKLTGIDEYMIFAIQRLLLSKMDGNDEIVMHLPSFVLTLIGRN